MQKRVRAIRERAGKARKATRWLAAGLLGSAAACMFLDQFYIAREYFVFMVIAALLVFVAAVLVFLGILLQEAARGILRYARKVQSVIAPQRKAYSEGRIRAIRISTSYSRDD